jgi:predicted DNA-binding transcriptional regulator YafY
MRELTATATSYQPRKISMEQFDWDEPWKTSKNMVSLELVFIKELESIVIDWFGEAVEKQEDGKLLVKVLLPENNWLYGFVLSFGMGVEVINPPHIRKKLAEISKGIYEKYSSDVTH